MSSIERSSVYPSFRLPPPPTNPEMTDSVESEQPRAEGLLSDTSTSCTIHILPSTSQRVESYVCLKDVIATAQILVNKILGEKNEFEGIRAAYNYVYGLPENEVLLETTSRDLCERLAALKDKKADLIGERDKIARLFYKCLEIHQQQLNSDKVKDYNKLMKQVHKNLQFYRDIDVTEDRIRNRGSLNIPISAYKCSSVACCLLKGIFCEILCLQCLCNDRSFTLRHAKSYEEQYGSCCLLAIYQKCVLCNCASNSGKCDLLLCELDKGDNC